MKQKDVVRAAIKRIRAECHRKYDIPGCVFEDVEHNHALADEILCDCLTAMGCAELVREYARVEKWYA